MLLSDIYYRAASIIIQVLRREWFLQGHPLTGDVDSSFDFKISGATLVGTSLKYAQTVSEGLRPDQINYRRMLPQMIKYFRLRGLPDNEAFRAAHFTILKWQKEGLPTEASRRFSQTGERKNFIQIAMADPRIDNLFDAQFDAAMQEKFEQTKNETI
jgi:hypothetical protein